MPKKSTKKVDDKNRKKPPKELLHTEDFINIKTVVNENIIKANKLTEKITGTIPYSEDILEIVQHYRILYQHLADYFSKVDTTIPYEQVKELVEAYKKDVENKLRELDDKYIVLECETFNKEKVKLKVNARLLFDKLTLMLGEKLWKHIALRMPPPELYIALIDSIYKAYNYLMYVDSKLELVLNYHQIMNEVLSRILLKLMYIDKELEFILSNKYETIYRTFKKYEKLIDKIGVENPEFIPYALEDFIKGIDKKIKEYTEEYFKNLENIKKKEK